MRYWRKKCGYEFEAPHILIYRICTKYTANQMVRRDVKNGMTRTSYFGMNFVPFRFLGMTAMSCRFLAWLSSHTVFWHDKEIVPLKLLKFWPFDCHYMKANSRTFERFRCGPPRNLSEPVSQNPRRGSGESHFQRMSKWFSFSWFAYRKL